MARRLDTDQAYALDTDVGMEDAHGVGAATDAGNHVVRLAPGRLRHLHQAFLADDGLEVPHHHRIGMRPRNRTNDVESIGDVGHPVAHGLVQRILERLGARFDGNHGRTEELHAIDVGRLALDVFRAHVDHALHAVAGSNRCRCHAVLSGTGFCDHARLAHAPGHHRLTDAVIHLVGTGVIEVFALQVDLRAAEQVGPALGMVNRAWAPDVVLQIVLELGDESRIGHTFGVRQTQLFERGHERLCDKDAAVRTEVALLIRKLVLHVSHLHLELRQ